MCKHPKSMPNDVVVLNFAVVHDCTILLYRMVNPTTVLHVSTERHPFCKKKGITSMTTVQVYTPFCAAEAVCSFHPPLRNHAIKELWQAKVP